MDSKEIEKAGDEAMQDYKVYKRRFVILASVVILNISNAALWINYSPVASTVADYYQVQSFAVNWFSLCYFIMPFPFCFIATFIIDKYGLKVGIYLGASMNVIGAFIKAFGTSGVVHDLGSQYAISLTGQTISASAKSFLLFNPTKVSQIWFPENHRALTTTLLSMANPLGLVIAQGATPFIVQETNDVPTNNYVWFGLAALAAIMAFLSFTRDKPKTPPSRSAEKGSENRSSYFMQLKEAFTCPPYLLMLFTLGCGIGVFSAMATLTQQLLCPLGYSDVVGGGANVAMVLFGFVGSAVMGILAAKTKKFLEISKLCFAGIAFFSIFMFEFLLVPNQTAALIIFYGIFGFFGIGGFPVGLELSVEATYPVEETISTAFLFLSGQIHAIIIIILVPAFASEHTPEEYYLDKCGLLDNEVLDYTVPIMVLMTYLTAVVALMVLMLQTKYKRIEAEVDKKISISDGNSEAMFASHWITSK